MSYSAPLGSEIVAVFLGRAYLPPPPNDIAVVFGRSSVPTPTVRRLSTAACVTWRCAVHASTAATLVHRATRHIDPSRAGLWHAAAARASRVYPGWRLADPCDTRVPAAWGAFSRLNPSAWRLTWAIARPLDRQPVSLWGKYEIHIDRRRAATWALSTPADEFVRGTWPGPRAPAWRLVPYVPSAIDQIQISVTGGGLRVRLAPPAGYVPPLGSAITAAFAGLAYTAPLGRYPGTSDIHLPFRRARVTVGAPIEPRYDAAGNPVIDTSALNTHRVAPWGLSRQNEVRRSVPWARYSRPLNPGWGVVTPPGDPIPEPGQQIIIPIRRAYIVLNETLLTRADDGQPLEAFDLRVSIDCDSWLPAWSASIPCKQRDAVMPAPTPVELIAYINGSIFRLLVGRILTSRRFGDQALDISGRGRATELSSPYAPVRQHGNATQLTAQQLIAAALEYTEYEQDWQITDWPVPAGLLNINGTPVDVAQHVAEGARAVLQAGWNDRTLRMLPRYPVKPWEWANAVPDVVIPAAVAETESIEWVERPDYNVVYVSGQLAGVLGQVKIAGTAGDKPAPSVTHPLITHVDAARQCGTAILGETGRSALMQISLPVLPSVGVIDVCKLIEFQDGTITRRGITRANSVVASFPVVRQTVTVEATA